MSRNYMELNFMISNSSIKSKNKSETNFLRHVNIKQILDKYPTPFHIYNEYGIRAVAANLKKEFNWVNGFKNYFAVKALPNPAILKILKEEGMGADCSSMAELVMAQKCGFKGEEIMFTSNDTPDTEFKKAFELGAIINLDDIEHIQFLENAIGQLPSLICFRYNPGSEKTGNQIIGKPEEAKYGLTTKQLFQAYKICQQKGVKRFGLHTMLISNELDIDYFKQTAILMFKIANKIKKNLGIDLEFINLGGGLGIPYKPEDQAINLKKLSKNIEIAYKKYFPEHNKQPSLYLECGRYITGPNGYLISKVLHLKHTYRDFVGLDASMANLMRPAIYGAYHHITVIGKENWPLTHLYDVTGSLCENNDKFAIQRKLPEINIGDFLIIHDTGAHGHSMGFNYNGKLRSAEILLKPDHTTVLIRRAETLDDYFATLNIDKHKF